jgi:hypothetical protein
MARSRESPVEPEAPLAVEHLRRPPDPAIDPEGFLTWHNWTQEDGCWMDPLGSNGPGQKVFVCKERTVQGEEKDVFQTRVPGLPWLYPIAGAVELQLLRDAEKRR